MRLAWLTWLAFFLLSSAVARASEPAGQLAEAPILVVYESRSGHTKRFAEAVVEGIVSVEGTRVLARSVDEVEDTQILDAAGIVLGCPVHWGGASAGSKLFAERLGALLLREKQLGEGATAPLRTAGAFVTGGAESSGKELARLDILASFLNLKFVVVGGEAADGFGTLGAQATTGPGDPGLSAEELDRARIFGRRFARVTRSVWQSR